MSAVQTLCGGVGEAAEALEYRRRSAPPECAGAAGIAAGWQYTSGRKRGGTPGGTDGRNQAPTHPHTDQRTLRLSYSKNTARPADRMQAHEADRHRAEQYQRASP